MKYKKPRPVARPKIQNRLQVPAQDEGLTGFVREIEASDIEERFARGLGKRKLSFSFRDHYFGPARSTPGAIEVDYIVETAGYQPIQIDGEFSHKTIGQRMEDKRKDARLNAYFGRVGINHVIRIPNPDDPRFPPGILDTQDGTDRVIGVLFA